MSTIDQPYTERRKCKLGRCEYLLNDEAKTAWIVKGPRIGRRRRYRIPDHVMIDGERYTIESVEIAAFKEGKCLKHLVIPDSILFVDEYNCSKYPRLQSIYVGKGLEETSGWIFYGNKKLRSFVISKDNPHLCVKDGIIYTKDGKCAITTPFNMHHINIQEGVEVVKDVAFWWNHNLEKITFPKTLKKIGDNSFAGCPKLKKVILPEGLEECRPQSFEDNENLVYADIPSTLKEFDREMFENCPNLSTLILRSDHVLKITTRNVEPLSFGSHCILKVPESLISDYKKHPLWSRFKEIIAI